MQSTTLNIGQSMVVTAQAEDAGGNLGASLTDIPSWSSSNTAVAIVDTVAPNGLSATVHGIAAGTCSISAAGLSSAGAFSTPFSVSVGGGPAVSFLYTFGVPS